MKNITLLIALLSSSVLWGQTSQNEIAASVELNNLGKDASYNVLYRRALANEKHWRLTGGLSLNTAKEVRSDSISLREGHVSYTLATGIQKDLSLEGIEVLKTYIALDGYWNSAFKKADYEGYYGYYWNFGFRPILGVSFEPSENLRLSLESNGNFNVNLQQYEGKGLNRDTRLSFATFDVLVLNLGYLF